MGDSPCFEDFYREAVPRSASNFHPNRDRVAPPRWRQRRASTDVARLRVLEYCHEGRETSGNNDTSNGIVGWFVPYGWEREL